MKKSRTTVIGILVIILMIVITVGATYAFFSYTGNGLKENKITTDGITFIYKEDSKKGRGIAITNANPISNETGKSQIDNKFDFRIESKPGNSSIKYTVTARRVSNSNALDGIVDLYLTDQESSNPEVFKDVTAFGELKPYGNSNIERVLYEKTISSADTDSNGKYEQEFRLRMWIDENADFTGTVTTEEGCSDPTYTYRAECEAHNETWTNEVREYPYNNKEFKIIVNVNAQATEEEPNGIKNVILTKNPPKRTAPTIKTPASDESGLYESTDTNSGDSTYYFRGPDVGNEVDFGGITWKVVRINEDGTIRMIATTPISTQGTKFSNSNANITDMYYSNSPVKTILENWYNDTFAGTKLDEMVVTGEFCEEFKTALSPNQVDEHGNSIPYYQDANYEPTFECSQNRIIRSKVGLLTVEEVIYSGKYPNAGAGSSYINFISYPTWTMSPAGMNSNAYNWLAYTGGVMSQSVTSTFALYPVINIRADSIIGNAEAIDEPYYITTPGPQQKTLAQWILDDNTLKTGTPNHNLGAEDEYNFSTMSGLYKESVTDGYGGSNGDTYYFHGFINNNYVDFAGKVWRVVRINEDGTVRLILNGYTQTDDLKYNSDSYTAYYTETDIAKPTVDAWFEENITGTDLQKVATGNYFCEAIKVIDGSNGENYGGGLANVVSMENYEPDLKCVEDGNGHGLVNASVGLLSVDEAMYAGIGFRRQTSYTGEHDNYVKNYMIKDVKTIGTHNADWWLMNPSGIHNSSGISRIWEMNASLGVNGTAAPGMLDNGHFRPVINLKADTLATYSYKTGHYVVD